MKKKNRIKGKNKLSLFYIIHTPLRFILIIFLGMAFLFGSFTGFVIPTLILNFLLLFGFLFMIKKDKLKKWMIWFFPIVFYGLGVLLNYLLKFIDRHYWDFGESLWFYVILFVIPLTLIVFLELKSRNLRYVSYSINIILIIWLIYPLLVGLIMIPSNIETFNFCIEDSNCIKVGTSCCASASCAYTAINKKYVGLWNTQFRCTGIGCLATICMKTFDVKCVNNQCKLIEDSCFDKWRTSNKGLISIKFKEDVSKKVIQKELAKVNSNNQVKFPFDIYSFELSKDKIVYDYNMDYIWWYVIASGDFIDYLNSNPNINAFVDSFEHITLIVNNEKLDKEDILKIVNSYNNIIKIENILVQERYYGFYNTEGEFARYICDNLENSNKVESIGHTRIFLNEIYETIGSHCTNRTDSFFPFNKDKMCS